jgi:uncharacterized protein YjbJ (UPF0337 family)
MTQDPTAGRYVVPDVTTEEPHDRYLPEYSTDPAADPALDPASWPIAEPTPGEPTATSEVARDEASKVGQQATDAGKHVAGVARDEAGNVAGEAKTQAKDLLHQARGEVRDQAGSQQKRAASGLHSISQQLGSMADGAQEPGVATDLARQASQRAHDVAAWLERGDPDQLLEDVRAFARRRPGAFLGIALAAGVVAGRLTRGITASDDDASLPQRGV